MRSVLVTGLLVLAACGPNLATSVDGDDSFSGDSAELTGELKAAVPSLTVWLRPGLTSELREGRRVFVLRGRASQNLEGVNSYVFDDPFGAATVLTARTFEVVFDANSELNSLAAGIRIFLAVRPLNTAVAPATASITLQPTFTAPTGSTSIFVRTDVLPIAVGDALTYRTIVRTTGGAPLTVKSSDGASFPTAKRGTDEWNVDLTFNQLRDAMDVTGELTSFSAVTSSGAESKRAVLGVAVKTLAITRADVEATWPPLQCTPAMQACLDALPASTIDSESCGTWYPVTRCQLPWRAVSLFNSPDDLSKLINATTTVNTRLASPRRVAFRAYGSQDFLPNTQLNKVLNGWKRIEPYGDLVDTGPITATALKNQLIAFGGGAEAMITAHQQTVLQQAFVAQRYERAQGTIVLYALYASGAARLTIIETSR